MTTPLTDEMLSTLIEVDREHGPIHGLSYWLSVIAADRATITSLQTRQRVLTEALEPFAKMAPHFVGRPRSNRPHLPEHAIYQVSTGGVPDAEITVGDFGRARSALSMKEGVNEKE